jgi:hypothetical protein
MEIVLVVALLIILVTCYKAVTRRTGMLVLASWVVVPSLMAFITIWGTWAAMDHFDVKRHCGHEDYLCEDWTPVATAHVLALLFAVGAPIVITGLWMRGRQKRRAGRGG